MSQFVSVSWSDDELISAYKLNQMASNEKYLLERSMPQLYAAYGMNKTDGLKIAGGIITIMPLAWREQRADISFGRFFTTGCRPVVNVTAAITDQVRVFTVVKGLGPGNVRPDDTGFTVIVNADPVEATQNHFPTPFHIHWMALGY